MFMQHILICSGNFASQLNDSSEQIFYSEMFLQNRYFTKNSEGVLKNEARQH